MGVEVTVFGEQPERMAMRTVPYCIYIPPVIGESELKRGKGGKSSKEVGECGAGDKQGNDDNEANADPLLHSSGVMLNFRIFRNCPLFMHRNQPYFYE